MSNISAYNFESSGSVRIINGEWFVARDVCDLLDIKDASRAVNAIEAQLKRSGIPDTISNRISLESGGQVRKMIIVNEAGVNMLMMQSKKASAIKAKFWLASEVLPSIRQTGGFQLETPSEKEQVLLTDGRKALSNGVKQLTRVLKRNGKGKHFQDVWKLVHLKSGMQSIEQATPEQIETAMTYIGEVLEGELLAPDLPEGMVMVNKNHLDGMLVSLKLQKENLKSFMKLEREAICNAEIMQVMVDKTLGVRHEISQTRYKMHDCINDASMIADIVERQLNI